MLTSQNGGQERISDPNAIYIEDTSFVAISDVATNWPVFLCCGCGRTVLTSNKFIQPKFYFGTQSNAVGITKKKIVSIY